MVVNARVLWHRLSIRGNYLTKKHRQLRPAFALRGCTITMNQISLLVIKQLTRLCGENIHFRTLPLDHYTIDEDRQEYASDFEDVSSGFLDVAAEDPEYTRIMKAVRPYLLELMDKDFCFSSYMFDQELIYR